MLLKYESMAEKEKQHFVPKFYLKRFSFNEEEQQIGIYNKTQGKYIQQGSLKAQAYKKNYYGKDGELEDALGMIEGKMAPLLSKICKENLIPKDGSKGHFFLLMLLVSTDLRNPVIREMMDKAISQLLLATQGDLGQFSPFFENGTLNLINAPQIIMRQMHKQIVLCSDLHFKFLINKTSQAFITSDNPVIKYNQFLEGRNIIDAATGSSSLGIQMILPLNHRLSVMFYDSKIYKVGDKKKMTLDLDDIQDVIQLNILQFLNSKNNVLFDHRISENDIKSLHSKAKQITQANLIKTHKPSKVYDKFGNEINSQIVYNTVSACITNLKIKGIKFTEYAKNLTLNNRLVQMREHYYKLQSKWE